MTVSLTIIRYRNIAIPIGFLSMAVFRLPLWLSKKRRFFKLMGCGKNGSFDKTPDLNQWAILLTHNNSDVERSNEKLLGKFISGWIDLFAKESFTILLNPVAGHGQWDKQEPFGKLNAKTEISGRVATLTRATIRLSKMKYFWNHVAPVASQVKAAKGFIFSVGIGEVPWVKQATFSVWESLDDMKAFAYGLKEHSEVIRKTRKEDWYSEDMFVRFLIIDAFGSLRGVNPLISKN